MRETKTDPRREEMRGERDHLRIQISLMEDAGTPTGASSASILDAKRRLRDIEGQLASKADRPDA